MKNIFFTKLFFVSIFRRLSPFFAVQKAKFRLKQSKNKVLSFVGGNGEEEKLLKCPKSYEKKLLVSLWIDLHCVMESFEKPTEFAFRLSLFVLSLLIHLTSSALFKLLSFKAPR